MAKKAKQDDRRERIEQMRREAAAAERRRTMLVIAACAVVALVIIVATTWALLQRQEDDQRIAATDLDTIGQSASAAGCEDVVTRATQDLLSESTTENDSLGEGRHFPEGMEIDYKDSPPAFGFHWPAPAPFDRKFYTVDDRPAVEQLVHNLEHGYTVLWYDESVTGADLTAVEDIAAKFEGSDEQTAKFIAAPWTSDDGDDFPGGKHVALTHWSAEGGGDDGSGVWQFCEAPSGEAVADFMADYPWQDAMEPGAM